MISALLYTAGVVIFILAIFVSIALHELGHLLTAKRFGARVSQYMVGFGPTLVSFRRGDTEYGIKAVPLGGYVKIIGMFPPSTQKEHARSRGDFSDLEVPETSEEDPDETTLKLRKSNTGVFAQMVSQTRAGEFELVEPGDEDRLFYKLPVPKKVVVMAAGPVINIALAFCCLLAVYSLHGIHSVEPTGSTVVAGVGDCVIAETAERTRCTESDPISPARQAGLQSGDEIVALNGEQMTSWEQVQQAIRDNNDKQLSIEVVRDSERISLEPTSTVTMNRDLSEDSFGQMATVGYLGVQPESHEVVTRGGPIFTLQRMGEMTRHAVSTVIELPAEVWNVAQAITGQAERAQDGPISVVGGSRIAGEVTSSEVEGLGIGSKAALLALVVGSFNLFIGIFNLIPLMPLDGGHIVGASWEGLRRQIARLRRRPNPGYVDVAKQLPWAYGLGLTLMSMGLVLVIGDFVVPLSTGL